MTPHGLILFAHGARDARWASPFETVVQLIRRQRPELQVRLAFLEFMAPDLPTAAAELCGMGCRRIEVLPMFLGTGGHLRKDLPRLLEQLRERHPGVAWALHTAIGEHDQVMQAMAAAAIALLSSSDAANAPQA